MLHLSFRTIYLGQPNVGTWVKFSSVATLRINKHYVKLMTDQQLDMGIKMRMIMRILIHMS
jgi:hypothetical protein